MNNQPQQHEDHQNGEEVDEASEERSRRMRLFFYVVLGLFILSFFWGQIERSLTDVAVVSYSTFRQQVRDNNVDRVVMKAQRVDAELRQETEVETRDGSNVTTDQLLTYTPPVEDSKLIELLEEHGVEVIAEPADSITWGMLIIQLLPFLLIFGLLAVFFSRMSGQGQRIFSIGKSGAKLYQRSDEAVTFDDVAGADAAKEELLEVIEFLKKPERFREIGAKTPKGVLLVGPPGTGKTLMARAVAGEADVPFFSITGSDFMEMFVGVGASRVRDLFGAAKKAGRSIIFVDELDSIGRRRGAGLGGGHDEREQTLNQLLSELDGFESNEGVIVMAATNRPDILDPALLRPGRFDRQITVDLPTKAEREEILRIHARGKKISDDVNFGNLAGGTPGFSGADLENLLNEGALLAARRGSLVVEPKDLDNARDKVMMGLERRNLALSDDELQTLAYHESGHAVLAALLEHSDPLHKVTIVPRGRAMGVTQQMPERDRYVYSREYVLDRLAVMMGGRAAEDLVLEKITSGAANDLKEATRLARKLVLDWGMTERLGHVAFGNGQEQVFLGEDLVRGRDYSDATAQLIDEEVRGILESAYKRATDVLTEHRDGLDRLARALLDKEELSGKQAIALIKGEQEQEAVGTESEESEEPQEGESETVAVS